MNNEICRTPPPMHCCFTERYFCTFGKAFGIGKAAQVNVPFMVQDYVYVVYLVVGGHAT